MVATKLHFCGYRANIQHLLWHFDLFSFCIPFSPRTLLCLEFNFIEIQSYFFTSGKQLLGHRFRNTSDNCRAQMRRQTQNVEGDDPHRCRKVLPLFILKWFCTALSVTARCLLQSSPFTIRPTCPPTQRPYVLLTSSARERLFIKWSPRRRPAPHTSSRGRETEYVGPCGGVFPLRTCSCTERSKRRSLWIVIWCLIRPVWAEHVWIYQKANWRAWIKPKAFNGSIFFFIPLNCMT